MSPPILFLEPSLCYDPNGFFVQCRKCRKLNSSISMSTPFPVRFLSTTSSPRQRRLLLNTTVIYPRLPGLFSLELPQYNHFQLSTESSLSKNPIESASTAIDSEKRSYHQHRFGPYMSPSSGTVEHNGQTEVAKDKRQDKMFAEAFALGQEDGHGDDAGGDLQVTNNDENDGVYGGELGRLNRQQVVMNSPVAQTVLCLKGFCV
ncbi:transcription factor bHLH [Forsythia ovata]|uniref:Transcription factor bHLH n=1 Tax=Forsythia ovata TaxID=205694 RepID=A0ABD1WC17_9LAMI